MFDVWYLGERNLMSDSDVYLFTRIRTQRWHVSTLYCHTHTTWAECHITLQTMLGISRLGYSCWRLVAGNMCEVLQYGVCLRSYVTVEWRWWPKWVRIWYSARTHVLHMHCSPAQSAFTATVTRTHIGQQGDRHWTNNADRR